MIGELISAGSKLLGGFLDREAQEDINKQQIAQAEANRKMQLDFATRGIEWKVNDALRAGVHPLFALGASTHSYSPVNVGLEKASLGPALAEMGQDVGRAVASTGGEAQRATQAAVSKITLEGLQLDNDIKRAKLASDLNKLKTPAVGPASGIGDVPEASKAEERPLLSGGEGQLDTNKKITNAEDFEKRYGELTDFVYGPQIWMRDELDRAGGYELNKFLRKVFQKLGILN